MTKKSKLEIICFPLPCSTKINNKVKKSYKFNLLFILNYY